MEIGKQHLRGFVGYFSCCFTCFDSRLAVFCGNLDHGASLLIDKLEFSDCPID
jgi:hypothetical protein